MNRLFIGMSIIMFLARISTLPGIQTQLMFLLGGICKIRFWNILSKKYSTSKANNYLSPFILYPSDSIKDQFMMEIITSLSTSSFSLCPIIGSRCTSTLIIISIISVVLIFSIAQGFKCMDKGTYNWIQDSVPHCSKIRCNARHYREINFRYFMLAIYGAQAARELCVNSPRVQTPRHVLNHK